VIVVAGGDAVPARVATLLPAGALVVAADSGIDQAHALGLHVDIAVGDFDSVSAAALDRVVADGAVVERHPAAKDKTDLELALGVAMANGADDIVVVGGYGGRIDHLVANVELLATADVSSARVTAHWSTATVHVLRGARELTLDTEPGALVSLVPVHGAAEGVWTDGLRYPLHHEDLTAGSTRGVSNVVERRTARVGLDRGTLLVVLPGVADEGALT
jgi:thiamine pyrophosphokinase